jgi:hypothetical protein
MLSVVATYQPVAHRPPGDAAEANLIKLEVARVGAPAAVEEVRACGAA